MNNSYTSQSPKQRVHWAACVSTWHDVTSTRCVVTMYNKPTSDKKYDLKWTNFMDFLKLQRQKHKPTKAISKIKKYSFLQKNCLKSEKKNKGQHALKNILRNIFNKNCFGSMQLWKPLWIAKFRLDCMPFWINLYSSLSSRIV